MPLEKKHKRRIAFLVQLPLRVSPGQRFRFENWIPYLQENEDIVTLFPFLDDATYKIVYQPGFYFKKITGTVKGFVKRFSLLFRLHRYDFIFLQREVTPIGPPVLEWLITKIFRKKIIYDYDDAIWIPTHRSKFLKLLKCSWKVKLICKWSYKISVGNKYLGDYAAKHSKKEILLLPTVVDTVKQHNILKKHEPKSSITIGWTGSHSTLEYLQLIAPVLQNLYTRIPFNFLVIADRRPEINLPLIEFIKWNEQSEITDLLKMDIGVMPLKNDAWSEGKCGFKLIQYLSLGIPAVASPVGVNKNIICNGENGFVCSTDDEWIKALEILIIDHKLREDFGKKGRKTVENFFSINAQKQTFLSLFE